MRFELDIVCDNAAFHDYEDEELAAAPDGVARAEILDHYRAGELSRILRSIAIQIETTPGLRIRNVLDVNGNTVGHWSLTESLFDEEE